MSKHLVCFSVRTNTRKTMIMSRIFKVVVWQLMCDNFGDLEMMSAQSVPSERESTCYICRSSMIFGKWILEKEYIILTDPTPNLYLVFERNYVKLLSWSLWGFCLLGMNCHWCETTG